MTIDSTPYRTAAERPKAPSPPVLVPALLRLGTIVLVLAGIGASVFVITSLPRLARDLSVFGYTMAVCGVMIPRAVSIGDESWLSKQPWSRVYVVAAWAPLALLLLGIWRLVHWLLTGE